jgi:hypothetical protein
MCCREHYAGDPSVEYPDTLFAKVNGDSCVRQHRRCAVFGLPVTSGPGGLECSRCLRWVHKLPVVMPNRATAYLDSPIGFLLQEH